MHKIAFVNDQFTSVEARGGSFEVDKVVTVTCGVTIVKIAVVALQDQFCWGV